MNNDFYLFFNLSTIIDCANGAQYECQLIAWMGERVKRHVIKASLIIKCNRKRLLFDYKSKLKAYE